MQVMFIHAVECLGAAVSCHNAVLYNTILHTKTTQLHMYGLVQERCNSSANPLELRLSCANPSIRGWRKIQQPSLVFSPQNQNTNHALYIAKDTPYLIIVIDKLSDVNVVTLKENDCTISRDYCTWAWLSVSTCPHTGLIIISISLSSWIVPSDCWIKVIFFTKLQG